MMMTCLRPLEVYVHVCTHMSMCTHIYTLHITCICLHLYLEFDIVLQTYFKMLCYKNCMTGESEVKKSKLRITHSIFFSSDLSVDPVTRNYKVHLLKMVLGLLENHISFYVLTGGTILCC